MSDPLHDLRVRIDEVDARIVSALNERLELVERLWHLKQELGIARLDPSREEEIQATLRATNTGPLTDTGLDEVVELILSLTKRERGRHPQGP